MNKLSRQQQKYLRAIENKYLLPRWSNVATLIADIHERAARAGTPDNDAVHGFVKLLYTDGRSTNDLPMPPNDWLMKFRAYWQQKGVDIPEPNGVDAAEMIRLYELTTTKEG